MRPSLTQFRDSSQPHAFRGGDALMAGYRAVAADAHSKAVDNMFAVLTDGNLAWLVSEYNGGGRNAPLKFGEWENGKQGVQRQRPRDGHRVV